MWDFVWRLLAGLQPEPNADAQAQYAWDRRIGLTISGVILMGIVLAVLVAAILGLVPMFSPGFLKAGELGRSTIEIKSQIALVQKQVDDSNVQDRARWSIQLSNALLDVRSKHCKAKSEEAKRLYWDQISQMMSTYHGLTGQTYTLPQCGDL